MEGSLGPVTATQCDHMRGATSPPFPRQQLHSRYGGGCRCEAVKAHCAPNALVQHHKPSGSLGAIHQPQPLHCKSRRKDGWVDAGYGQPVAHQLMFSMPS